MPCDLTVRRTELVDAFVPQVSTVAPHLKIFSTLAFVRAVLSSPFEIILPFAIRGTYAVPPWEGNVY